MKATAKELRFKTKEILAAIERGEEVIITYRGKDKARLVPLKEGQHTPAQKSAPLFGIWSDNERVRDVDTYIKELRGGRFGTR